jgi:uncharacterized ferritin-like protein (DUF455 family)
MLNIFECAQACIAAADPDRKCQLTRQAHQAWEANAIDFSMPADAPDSIAEPGRPARPPLVPASQLHPRKLASEQGRAALLHALAHIEFNAINLAWDAVYRFRDMPQDFYTDWLGVAADESRHFALLRERLRDLGYDYGDFPAHDGLWDMAIRTSYDILVRMALVPRALEARGLDVTPSMISRLQQHGDVETARILEVILHDEIGHVASGSRWFTYLCGERGLEPLETFRQLLAGFLPGRVRSPVNVEARTRAGFSDDEIELLKQLAMEHT